jgi:long-chain acyl-CoA synthetase
LQSGATDGAEELIRYARSRLSATKAPREIRIVDTIPLTSVGKLDRKALRAMVVAPTVADG